MPASFFVPPWELRRLAFMEGGTPSHPGARFVQDAGRRLKACSGVMAGIGERW